MATPPPFLKFTSFDNLDDSKTGLAELLASRGQWYAEVTEKIHGSNFVVVVWSNHIICGKRTGYLTSGEAFFGGPEWVTMNKDRFFATRDIIREKFHCLAAQPVYFYGELFGGKYGSDKKTKCADGAKQVQKDANYSPQNHYAVFNIRAVDGWLCRADVETLCEKVGLMTVPHVMSGTFQNIVTKNPELFLRPTVIPERLGLEPLPEPNFAEGVVIKLFEREPTSGQLGSFGLTLKWKHPRFREQLERSKGEKADQKETRDSVDPIIALGYVVPARVSTYVSKMSETDVIVLRQKKNFGMHIRDLALDAFKDYWKDHEKDLKGPGGQEVDQNKVYLSVKGVMETASRNQLLAWIKN